MRMHLRNRGKEDLCLEQEWSTQSIPKTARYPYPLQTQQSPPEKLSLAVGFAERGFDYLLGGCLEATTNKAVETNHAGSKESQRCGFRYLSTRTNRLSVDVPKQIGRCATAL